MRGRTSWKDKEASRHPDRVNRRWDIKAANTVWVADFAYVWT
ncbi:hypothetical protein [Pseudarthrobacter sp. IC2-21]|nr:hypothetical protein [Pseudarthrobacter sp. IC2-21]